jgi:predicted ribosome quality control (RQC) complex YloA/Tae2 family protein
MKTEISSLDLHFLTKEFQSLVGGKIDKIYQKKDDKKDLLFRFHVTSEGKKLLRFRLPGLIYLTETKEDYPETPPGYCMFLRKYLGNARLSSIEQRGFERILHLTFEKKTQAGTETYHLIVELFSKGNMILCDHEMKIKNPLENQHWTGREIRPKQPYGYPPASIDTPRLGEDEFITIMAASNKESIVKALAIDFALGGEYAEEVINRAGMQKETPPSKIITADGKKIFYSFQSMLKEHIKPVISKGRIFPFPFKEAVIDQRFNTFSEALDSTFTKPYEKQEHEHQEKIDKVELILKEQTQKLEGYSTSASDNQRKGELIYEHYQEIKTILEDIRAMHKKHDWKTIKEKYKGHALVKDIDEKTGNVIVEL